MQILGNLQSKGHSVRNGEFGFIVLKGVDLEFLELVRLSAAEGRGGMAVGSGGKDVEFQSFLCCN